MKLDNFESQVFFTTVRITVPNEQNMGASIGTGFIYSSSIADDPQNRRIILLISNRHVFGDPKNTLVINFHKKNPENGDPILGETNTLRQEGFHNNYFPHPNENVDLACMNISFIADKQNQIYHKNLHLKFFEDIDENEIIPGSDVLFIGYPENRFDINHNLPILRKGIIATIPTIDFNGQKQFLIDAQVLKGSSGSPVFASIKGNYKLVGVVSQTMIKHQKLTTIPTAYDFGVEQTLGLGVVLKKVLVEELIENAVSTITKLIKEKEDL